MPMTLILPLLFFLDVNSVERIAINVRSLKVRKDISKTYFLSRVESIRILSEGGKVLNALDSFESSLPIYCPH